MANNLKKTHDMDVGTVGYKNPKLVKTVRDIESDNSSVKEMIKT